jgi:hypothetical protein
MTIAVRLAILSSPSIADEGGPDAYGYSWLDNDGGGGPGYNWIDITDFGIQVDGLVDDNNVGPIPLDFEFPYYWYMVDHLWIESNGGISFTSSTWFVHPFSSIPSSTSPNDLVAILGGDLDITRGGSCYYYTNSVDTFIVSWLALPQFSPDYSLDDSVHTFQLILSKVDSSLTFQYGENHGDFDEFVEVQDLIGIENANGQIGLEYLEDNLPSNRMWHQGLIIKFHPVPNPDLSIHDVGIKDGMLDGSGALFWRLNSPVYPQTLLRNFGNVTESSVLIRCIIKRGTTEVYSQNSTAQNLAPGEERWVEFATPYSPNQNATHSITFSTVLTGDMNATNNMKTTELDVFVLPQYLGYGDDTPAPYGRALPLPFSGFASEYQVPVPLKITVARFRVAEVEDNGLACIWILAEGDGRPDIDSILAADTVAISFPGWYSIDFSWSDRLLFMPDEKFYLAVFNGSFGAFEFSVDDSEPLSNRCWKYVDGFSPHPFEDLMMPVYADTVPGWPCQYVPGDINGDGGADGLDVTYGVNYWQGNVPAPYQCFCLSHGSLYASGDVNSSCAFNGVDITYYVRYLHGGPPLGFCSDCSPASQNTKK